MTYISNFAYTLGDTVVNVKELGDSGQLTSSTSALHESGFERAHIFSSKSALKEAVVDVAKNLLGKRRNTQYVIFYQAVRDNTRPQFDYFSKEIAKEVDMVSTENYFLSEDGCAGSLAAIDLARRICKKDESALILSYDMLFDRTREIIHNVVSDAVSGLLVSAELPELNQESVFKLGSYRKYSFPEYAIVSENSDQILASYFPLIKKCFEDFYTQTGTTHEDYQILLPHNVNKISWKLVAKLVDWPLEKIFMNQIGRSSHTISSDHVINIMATQELLSDTEDQRPFLLVTFGFGQSFSFQVLEKVPV